MIVSSLVLADVQQGVNLGVTAQTAVDARNQSVTIAHPADLSQAVGAAMAPALTTTLTETCMGSTSVGGGFSGGSFSFGTTWRDSACVRRLDAREIHSYGDLQAAKEIMCDSDLVRAAFKRVGRPCVEDGGSYTTVAKAAPVAAPPVASTETEVNDDQDVIAKRYQGAIEKAAKAREEMRARKGF